MPRLLRESCERKACQDGAERTAGRFVAKVQAESFKARQLPEGIKPFCAGDFPGRVNAEALRNEIGG
jgi:hypothetical protein